MIQKRSSLGGGDNCSQGSPFFLHCCINLQHHLAYINQPQTLVDTEGVVTWQWLQTFLWMARLEGNMRNCGGEGSVTPRGREEIDLWNFTPFPLLNQLSLYKNGRFVATNHATPMSKDIFGKLIVPRRTKKPHAVYKTGKSITIFTKTYPQPHKFHPRTHTLPPSVCVSLATESLQDPLLTLHNMLGYGETSLAPAQDTSRSSPRHRLSITIYSPYPAPVFTYGGCFLYPKPGRTPQAVYFIFLIYLQRVAAALTISQTVWRRIIMVGFTLS